MNDQPLQVPSTYIPSLERRALAYVVAVAVAAFYAMAFFIIVPWVDGKITNPSRSDHLLVTLFLSLLDGIVTALVALVPCVMAEQLAGLLRFRGGWYFIMLALTTAVVLGPAVGALLAPGPWDEEYWSGVIPAARYFAPEGALCGLVYWRISRGDRAACARLAQW